MIVPRRIPAVSVTAAVLVFFWMLPGKAGAAIQLGQVTPGAGSIDCAPATNSVQLEAVSARYDVPSAGGVITNWSHKASAGDPGSGRLQVWAQVGHLDFTLVGRSALRDFTPGAVNSFPTRIPVGAGDLLGLRSESGTGCAHLGAPGDLPIFQVGTDLAPGETMAVAPALVPEALINVSALLEPDADGDGFGDETQDRCPARAGPDNGCPPPPPEDDTPPPEDGTPPPEDGTPLPPDLTLDAKRKQKPKKLKVDVACGMVACSVELAGKGKVPTASGAAVAAAKKKKFKLKPKRVEVAAGATETVRLKFKRNRRSVKKIKRLLKQGGKKTRKRAKAVVKATATSAGGADSAKQKVKLKR